MIRLRHLMYGTAVTATLVAITIPVAAQLRSRRGERGATGIRKSFEFQDQTRAYRIHIPKGYDSKKKTPLVLVLHGGGGDAQVASKMGMTPLADQHGFIVAYPEGIDRHWNDGRRSEYFLEHDKKIDDVAFVTELVKRLKSEWTIDPDQVFCLGPSNGGFMTQRLAIERSELFSAVAVLIATMGEPLKETFAPDRPVSILFINGTEDPLVPYNGGEVKVNLFPKLARFQKKQKSRGNCISTDDAIDLWLQKNGLPNAPEVEEVPDTDPQDGSTIQVKRWTGGHEGTAVALYRVDGGGHTLPGAVQYLRESIIGKTNRDIDAMETVWEFFMEYNREP